jgi:hypothetical protein
MGEEAPVGQLINGRWEDTQEWEDRQKEGTPGSYLMDEEAPAY